MWKLSFSAMIWTIWKEMNECCFEARSFDYWHFVERVRMWLCGLLPSRNLEISLWPLFLKTGKRWIFPTRQNCISPLDGSPFVWC